MKTKLALIFIFVAIFGLFCAQNSVQKNETTSSKFLTKAEILEKQLQSSSKDDIHKIDILRNLCREFIDNDNIKLAFYAKSMLQISSKLKDINGQADAYNFLGIVADIDAHYAIALDYYGKSLALVKKSDNLKLLASVTNNIALIEWKMGNLQAALSSFFTALKHAEILSSDKLQGNISSNIGLVFQDLRRKNEALLWQKKALYFRKKSNDTQGIASTYTNLATAYSYLNKIDSSIFYQHKAINLQLKTKDAYGLGISYLNLGEEYKALHKIKEALKFYNKSKEIREEIKDSLGLSFTYINLATTYKDLGKLKEAIFFGEKSLVIAKKIKSDERIAENSRSLSAIYRSSGYPKKALVLLQQYTNYHEKIFNQDMNDRVAYLNVQYETEKRQKELILANLKVSEGDLISKQKNLWLALLGSFIMIGMVVFRNYSIKSRHQKEGLTLKNKLLQEQTLSKIQEQRLEISRDLHDSLGAHLTLMSAALYYFKTAGDKFDDKFTAKINSLSDFVDVSILELKNTLWVLNSEAIYLEDFRLKLLNFISKAQEAKDDVVINFSFEIVDNKQIDSKIAVNLFRVFQEIFNNALKYSRAESITIEAEQKINLLKIKIEDNGIGFDIEKENTGSYGLANIKNRIESLNGVLRLQTALDEGTIYHIEINL